MWDWLEERTGYRALVRSALDEEIRGGARLRYVFGAVLVFLFVNQAVTGTLLALGYAPSVNDAWSSVAYMQERATLGWLVRGMHASGASAAFLVVVLHLVQVAWAGAQRRPREVTWWIGLALLGLLFAFGLTGYLLPWDQKGYAATQVATSLLGATPVVGPSLQRVVQGGTQYGNLTLTHFYALHVLVLPAIVLTLVVVHVALVRRHGVTPPPASTRTGRFYPQQVALDLGAVVLCLGAMVMLTLRSHGAALDAPADPSSVYEARPEWYFLPLFELLRHLPGSLEVPGALVVPTIAGGLLVALPFVSQRAARAIVVALVVAAVVLGVAATVEDRHDVDFQRGRARADAEARVARMELPGHTPHAHALGTALFDARCAGCHVLGGRGEAHAPDLDGFGSRVWIDAFFAAPDAPRFFGRTTFHAMKPVTAAPGVRRALVEWVYAQGGSDGTDASLVARGADAFEAERCAECHEKDGTSDGFGIPNLGGHGSRAWLETMLADPGAETHFGRKNEMPKVALSPTERDALVDLLRAQR